MYTVFSGFEKHKARKFYKQVLLYSISKNCQGVHAQIFRRIRKKDFATIYTSSIVKIADITMAMVDQKMYQY